MLNSPYRWESAAPPRSPSEPRWSPAGTRWTGRPRSSAAACRSGCDRPARLCAEPSDRACPQRSPGVRRAAVNTNLTGYTTRRDAYEQTQQQTFAPCFCSTSRMSLWALSAATCSGVMKLQDTTDGKLWPADTICVFRQSSLLVVNISPSLLVLWNH